MAAAASSAPIAAASGRDREAVTSHDVKDLPWL